MRCDQECEFLPLSRTEHGIAVIGWEVDWPVPFLQFVFTCGSQEFTSCVFSLGALSLVRPAAADARGHEI